MLKAVEARKIADEFNLKKRATANEIAFDEWSAYLEPKIMDATKCGRYSISYFWSKEVLLDLQVMPDDFTDALVAFAESLGYFVGVTYTKGAGQIVRVDVNISWKEVKDE